MAVRKRREDEEEAARTMPSDEQEGRPVVDVGPGPKTRGGWERRDPAAIAAEGTTAVVDIVARVRQQPK